MHKSIVNLNLIKEDLKSKISNYHNVKIIAVSKTFSIETIMLLNLANEKLLSMLTQIYLWLPNLYRNCHLFKGQIKPKAD